MRRPTKDAPSSTGKLFKEAREKSERLLQPLISDSSERFTDKTSPFGGATIKIMNNAETVNNVLASLYEALSDEAREMMLEVFREEDGE